MFLSKLRGEEEMLKQQLHSIESERKQLKEQTELAKEESKKLDQEEERFRYCFVLIFRDFIVILKFVNISITFHCDIFRYWKEYNDYKRQLLEFEDAQRRY